MSDLMTSAPMRGAAGLAIEKADAALAVGEKISAVLIEGDLSRLSSDERLSYYNSVCHSLGLNPLTKPFEFLRLNGKTVLYARRDCTEQLRKIHGIALKIVGREVVEGVYVVTAQAMDRSGRTDESIGAVPIGNLQGENRANAMMKSETKAKRRVTLSICGLGITDESEIDSIPNAHPISTEPAPARLAPLPAPPNASGARPISQPPPSDGRTEQAPNGDSPRGPDADSSSAASGVPVKAESTVEVGILSEEEQMGALLDEADTPEQVKRIGERARAAGFVKLYERAKSVYRKLTKGAA